MGKGQEKSQGSRRKSAEKTPKPKRQGLPKGVSPEDVTLEKALSLLALPREIGPHPETGKMIEAGIGRFGPFVKHDGKFASLSKDDDVMHIGMNRAVELIAQKEKKDAEKAAKGGGKKKAAPRKKTTKKGGKKKSAGKKKAAAKKKA